MRDDGSISLGLFGYGRDGLPDEMDDALGRPGAIDALADEIREKWTTTTRLKAAKSRRDAAERLSVEIGTLASILLWFHVRRKRVPSAKVAGAIDLALGVISPYSRKPVPSDEVLIRFGLPIVNDVKSILEAARLDGEADARGVALSQRELGKLVGKAPSTIRRWREMPKYAARRHFVRNITPAAR